MLTTLFEQDEKEHGQAEGIVAIEYRELSGDEDRQDAEDVGYDTAAVQPVQDDGGNAEEACEERVAAAREEVGNAVRAEWQARMHDALEAERTAVAVACTSFAKERERYFADVEGEVVKLALAIAARVLQREVKMDPLLLLGVVRVALSKLNSTQGVVLRVGRDEELWRKAMKPSGIAVEYDRAMGEAVQLKMAAGVAELGVEAQLVEIERGFFDLLAKRPA